MRLLKFWKTESEGLANGKLAERRSPSSTAAQVRATACCSAASPGKGLKGPDGQRDLLLVSFHDMVSVLGVAGRRVGAGRMRRLIVLALATREKGHVSKRQSHNERGERGREAGRDPTMNGRGISQGVRRKQE